MNQILEQTAARRGGMERCISTRKEVTGGL